MVVGHGVPISISVVVITPRALGTRPALITVALVKRIVVTTVISIHTMPSVASSITTMRRAGRSCTLILMLFLRKTILSMASTRFNLFL